MMHGFMMLIGVGLAIAIRLNWRAESGYWADRWQRSLVAFLFPPLLLLTTAVAIVCMGPSGQMGMHQEGWLSYGLAIAFLLFAAFQGFRLAWEGRQTLARLQQNPLIDLHGTTARLLPLPDLYSARVGFWQPELVISQGLLDTLDATHLEAVLVHEQAHILYRDTFWFFWLGCLRRVSDWLPQTEALWQELLMLREQRADRLATEQVDPLVLAEALLIVVGAALLPQSQLQPDVCAPFGWVRSPSADSRNASACDRLTERIDFLLDTAQPVQANPWSLVRLVLVCLPLLSIPFHA